MRANPAVARSDVNTNAPAATCAGPHFIADNGMGGRRALVGSPYVESGVGEIDLIPTQVDKLGRPQAVAEGDKDYADAARAQAGPRRRRAEVALLVCGLRLLDRPINADLSDARCLLAAMRNPRR